MPAGKKKTLLLLLNCFRGKVTMELRLPKLQKKLVLVRPPFLNIFKTKEELLSEIIKPLIPELKKRISAQIEDL